MLRKSPNLCLRALSACFVLLSHVAVVAMGEMIVSSCDIDLATNKSPGLSCTDLTDSSSCTSPSGEFVGNIVDGFVFSKLVALDTNTIQVDLKINPANPFYLRINEANTFYEDEGFIVSRYFFVTGNDYPARDPKDWTFYGCYDTDANCEVLDTVTDGMKDIGRLAKKEFYLSEPTPKRDWVLFKIIITDQYGVDGRGETNVQFSEFGIIGGFGQGCPPTPSPSSSPTLQPSISNRPSASSAPSYEPSTSFSPSMSSAPSFQPSTSSSPSTSPSNIPSVLSSSPSSSSSPTVASCDIDLTTNQSPGLFCTNLTDSSPCRLGRIGGVGNIVDGAPFTALGARDTNTIQVDLGIDQANSFYVSDFIVSRYFFVTSRFDPTYDPKDWMLYGCYEPDKKCELLDTVSNGLEGVPRLTKKEFSLSQPTPQRDWVAFRIIITDTYGLDSMNKTSVFIAEFGIIGGFIGSCPTPQPSSSPSTKPSFQPSKSNPPSTSNSPSTSSAPSTNPSVQPSVSSSPSEEPSSSMSPSANPSVSSAPSITSSSALPSGAPSSQPSTFPSMSPSNSPTTNRPSSTPSLQPSNTPSSNPSLVPSSTPSMQPSNSPSSNPSLVPSSQPSTIPSTPPSNPPTYPGSCPYEPPCEILGMEGVALKRETIFGGCTDRCTVLDLVANFRFFWGYDCGRCDICPLDTICQTSLGEEGVPMKRTIFSSEEGGGGGGGGCIERCTPFDAVAYYRIEAAWDCGYCANDSDPTPITPAPTPAPTTTPQTVVCPGEDRCTSFLFRREGTPQSITKRGFFNRMICYDVCVYDDTEALDNLESGTYECGTCR